MVQEKQAGEAACGALVTALHLIIALDRESAEIALLSLRISVSAVARAALIGMPLGAASRVGPPAEVARVVTDSAGRGVDVPDRIAGLSGRSPAMALQ